MSDIRKKANGMLAAGAKWGYLAAVKTEVWALGLLAIACSVKCYLVM